MSKYLVAGGFTILGSIIGASIAYFYAIRLSNFNSRKIAGLRLRDAFISELTQIRNPENNSLPVEEILMAAFSKHQLAVHEFSFFMTDKELIGLNNAWHQYYTDPKSKKKFLEQYWDGYDSTYQNGSSRQTAIERIEVILKFTKT